MHAHTLRVRPLVAPTAVTLVELDNPLVTRLLQLGIAAVMGLTLLVFHQPLLNAVTSAFAGT